ncbi:uncharacterized protein BXZ73DRAFT_109930 [Epithele typhae]|uniref:uncharacterized protein n=1 Tax=Epithele typhae TaxID=378194 RepID=UPI002007964C|nr:uncharacterized protein BXZ73DRAFT_109930 [Epithele typhae]KAH9908257.1 hypothetical protein BXZ73DRAFT_109930 [Epithele typhae]
MTLGPVFNLNLNMDLQSLFTVTKPLAEQASEDTVPLDHFVMLGGYHHLNSVGGSKRVVNTIFTNFVLPPFVDKAFTRLATGLPRRSRSLRREDRVPEGLTIVWNDKALGSIKMPDMDVVGGVGAPSFEALPLLPLHHDASANELKYSRHAGRFTAFNANAMRYRQLHGDTFYPTAVLPREIRLGLACSSPYVIAPFPRLTERSKDDVRQRRCSTSIGTTPTAPGPIILPPPNASIDEYQEALYQAHRKNDQLHKLVGAANLQIQDLHDSSSKSKKKKKAPGVHDLDDDVKADAYRYGLRVTLWLFNGVLTRAANPATCDPRNTEWRWKTPDPSDEDPHDRSHQARAAELREFLSPNVLKAFHRESIRDNFARHIGSLKTNVITHSKQMRAEIFSHIDSLRDVQWSSSNSLKTHPILSHLRGDDHDAILKTCRIMMFSKTALTRSKPASNSTGVKYNITRATIGMVAMATVVTRYLLSFDSCFSSVGPDSHRDYEADYEEYFKWMYINQDTKIVRFILKAFNDFVFNGGLQHTIAVENVEVDLANDSDVVDLDDLPSDLEDDLHPIGSYGCIWTDLAIRDARP